MQDHHMLGHSLCFIEVVGGQHDTATMCSEPGNDVSNHLTAIQIDSGGGLVKERDVGVGSKCQSKGESLPFATRETSPRGCRAMLQAHLLDENAGIDTTVIQPAIVAHE